MALELTVLDVIMKLRSGLIYDAAEADLKARILEAYETLREIVVRDKVRETLRESVVRDKVRDQTKEGSSQRFCLLLNEKRVWNNGTGQYESLGTRELFCIDGFYTESKIRAIKQARNNDNATLKEAKDLVDDLQDHPRLLDVGHTF